MNVKSVYRGVKISASKAREVTRAIQGLPALEALDRLQLYPKKAARFVYKTLKSAVANAENNNQLNPEDLFVKEAVVGESITMKRFITKARGSGGRILKRSSHIRIIVSDGVDEEPKKESQKKSK